MSLILDALRKSEAERRRGTSPDLFASLPAPVATRRPMLLRLWPWFAIVALGLGAASIFWISRKADAPAAAAPVPGEVADGQRADLVPANGPSAPPIAAPDAAAASDAATMPAVAPAPANPPALAGAGQQSIRPNTTAMPRPPPVPAMTGATMSPTVAPADDALAPLPPIAVLSANERASLPPLKLSMHVWDGDPGKRFAIIDGQRVGEGAMVGNGVIQEIRRDGVVIEVDGRRILLPRP